MHKTILVLVFIVATSACVRDTATESGAPSEPGIAPAAIDDVVDPVQGTDLVFHMIATAAEPDAALTQQGAGDAAAALGAEIVWHDIDAEAGALSATIETALSDEADGIALRSPVADTVDADSLSIGVPVVIVGLSTIQSRTEGTQFTHVGPTELDVGRDAGTAFNELGATKVVCTTPSPELRRFEERCNGLRDTFNGEVLARPVGTAGTEVQGAIASILAADTLVDGVLGIDPIVTDAAADACAGVDRLCLVGGVGLSETVAERIDEGAIGFAVDLRAYAQGYYAVAALYMRATQGTQEHSSLNTDTAVISSPSDG